MDPKLLVLMLIIVILSTLTVITIFRASEPEDLMCLGNRYPEIFVKESAQKGVETSFSFSVISGRDLGELELRFSILYEKTPSYDPADWEPDEKTSLKELASHIPVIATLESELDLLGIQYEVLERVVEVNGTSYDAVLYDFGRFMGLFSDGRSLSQATAVFAVLGKDDDTRFFQGRTGFFLEQDQVVEYLTIARGENRTEYIDLGDAPFGIMRYADVEKDEKISVAFDVQAEIDLIPEISGAGDQLLLQIIKGYVDGDMALLITNGIPVG